MTYIPDLGTKARSNDRTGRPVVAYLKPSDYCNVGCDHCYLPITVRQNKTRMTFETLDSAIKTIRQMVDRQRAPGALIVWHGGEPLALPQEYFRAACERVRELMPDAVQTIQTSLIPYKESWASLISEYFDGQTGTSIDFSQRKIKGNVEKYHTVFLDKVESARRSNFHIIPGVVPSRGDLGRAPHIALWMLENKFFQWNIDRYNSHSGFDPMRPTNKEHSEFLTEVFDEVMALLVRGTFMNVNTVQAALSGIMMNIPGDRWGGSCSRDFIVVNPDGSTSACPDKISFETDSNVSGGFDAFEASTKRKSWIRNHLSGHRNDDCPTCPFNTFCRSGCPLTPNTPETEGECSGYNRHLRHVRTFMEENHDLTELYLKRAQE
ncbi:radical SAM protein [Loktanella sp. DJP18]|uniref:radical SAM protein n=1 Tax=Loktanella sp. DJP18 TaxID=3409788 RepID=UPI003BB687E4